MADSSNKRRFSEKLTTELLAHKAIVWWLPLLYFLISSLFYLRTYDSAQVKITIMQMGGLALLAFWVIRLVEAGLGAFSKDDMVCLSPFLAYLLVGILSFLHAPYHMASVDFFLRHFFFMTAALIAIYELDAPAVERLTKILIWTGWVAIGYGFLQVIDSKFFPPGVGKGIDPFIWRMAFGDREFSTYGNPNFFADFLVIIFPILLTQFLKTKRWSLVPLMGMLVVDLVMTDTKGAWVGFAIVLCLFGLIAFIYFDDWIKPFKKWIVSVVSIGALALVVMTARGAAERLASVNFRLFTWEGTWEMIMTQPWTGTGVGSFPPIYPAFRRPPIFHIEGKHNTETDHSEDEYLEELFDNGILGFGIFLWLVISTLVVGFRSLGQLTGPLKLRDGRLPPRGYDLLGYMVAFMGMLGHNLFDVSLRFVSSGVYLGLLSGMIVNLARGKALFELHEAREGQGGGAPAKESKESEEASAWKTACDFLIWPARLAALGAVAYLGFLITTEFNALQGGLDNLQLGGEVLQWWMSWGTLLACLGGLGYVFARLILLTENPVVPLIVLLAAKPMYTFWGYFKADINHNIAIYFSKERNWDQALGHYFEVHKLNPDFVMSLYFEGNVYNDRFDMRKVYNPAWGDTDNVPRDDYERALDAYNEVRRLAPNYVQMHHQVGNLHMKRAEWALQNGHPEQVQYYLNRAMTRFRMYRAIDPVYPPNYFRMGQIYMMEKRYDLAARIYEDYIKADKCAVAPSLASKPELIKTILAYQTYVNEPGIPYPVHRHESAEAYTNLANAYYMMGRLPDAAVAYIKALGQDPNFPQAKQNLAIVYQKARQDHRLSELPPPPPGLPAVPMAAHAPAVVKP